MDHCKIEVEDGVAILEICRPEVLNALNSRTLEEMLTAIKEIAIQGHVKAMIVIGEGEKAFIAGADIGEMYGKEPREMLSFCSLGQRVTIALEEAPFPTIAAINGYALGGGLEVALGCDFSYASETAKLGLPEVTLGIIPGFGGTQRLQRAVGMRRAKEMIYTGKMIEAKEALQMGLVNELFPNREALLAAAIKTAKRITTLPTPAINRAKAAINSGSGMGIREALELERNLCMIAFSTDEAKEGMRTFFEKRAGR